MKIAHYIIIALCLSLAIFNATHINTSDLFGDQNTIPFIGVFAPICGLILLLILIVSKKIKNQL